MTQQTTNTSFHSNPKWPAGGPAVNVFGEED